MKHILHVRPRALYTSGKAQRKYMRTFLSYPSVTLLLLLQLQFTYLLSSQISIFIISTWMN